MAKLEYRPISKEDKAQAIAALQAYKAQNPAKFAAKKDALYAKYGLAKNTKIEVEDAVDEELEEMADLVTSKPVTETKTKKNANK